MSVRLTYWQPKAAGKQPVADPQQELQSFRRRMEESVRSLGYDLDDDAVTAVVDYATTIIGLVKAESALKAAAKSAVESFTGYTLARMELTIDKHGPMITEVRIIVTRGGQELNPETPRPTEMGDRVRTAINDVLKPLGLQIPHIIIPSSYDQAPGHDRGRQDCASRPA